MRIRKPPKLGAYSTEEAAAYLADKWAGRAICSADLQTIYGLAPGQTSNIARRLAEMGVIEATFYTGGPDSMAIYRLRGHHNA